MKEFFENYPKIQEYLVKVLKWFGAMFLICLAIFAFVLVTNGMWGFILLLILSLSLIFPYFELM